MSASNSKATRFQPGQEQTVELSAEERTVVQRVQKKTVKKRESHLRRFVNSPPLFYWWWHWL